MKNKTLFFLFVSIPYFSYTQTSPEIEWQNTIGGDAEDRLCSIEQTPDGGYILGAYSASGISGDKSEISHGDFDYWIIKLGSEGEVIWQNTIGGSGAEILTSIHQTKDGGFILGGYSSSPASGDKTEDSFLGTNDYWVVKVDSNGNVEWENTIGGAGNDEMQDAGQTTDGGYILGGRSDSPISGDKTEVADYYYDYWVVKLDSIGNILWDNTIGGSEYDYLYAVLPTNDNGTIIGGMSTSPISGDKTEAWVGGGNNFWILKLDVDGNIIWQNAIGGNDADWLFNIVEADKGGFILKGYSDSDISEDKTETNQGYYDYWTVAVDSIGNVLWDKTIGGASEDISMVNQNTPHGRYIFSGNSLSNISGDKTEANIGFEDYWVVILDSIGTILWQKTLGGWLSDFLTTIDKTTDEGYILGGYSFSPISGNKTEENIGAEDLWVIKLAGSCTNYTFYHDSDGDGYGNDLDSIYICEAPLGYVANNIDCDDTNAAIYPDAPEIENGIDDNCNGEIDEGLMEVEHLILNNEFFIFPNPTFMDVYISLKTPINSFSNLIVTDIAGKIIFNSKIFLNSVYKFDASTFSPGIYYIKLTTEERFICRSFIKL